MAHVDIEPTEEWQREIERALFSMDALVALLSEDFHDSDWTDQEVGIAMGRGVPLVAVRLGMDPYGLMGKGQAVTGYSWSDPEAIAVKIFHLLHKRLPDKSRLFECALLAYAHAGSFADSAWKVKHLLSTFESLSMAQVDRVVRAYRENGQNRSSFDGMNRLQPLLEKWTGEQWTVKYNELQRARSVTETELPF